MHNELALPPDTAASDPFELGGARAAAPPPRVNEQIAQGGMGVVALAWRSQIEGRPRELLGDGLGRHRMNPLAVVLGGVLGLLIAVHGLGAQAPQPAVDAQTRRVRELIYMLRQHRVFSRCDEWAGTIRELVEIGKPAVPELVAELNGTDRDATLRALGFTLRAIGDPRAVPGLIRAIPKTLRPPGSDCGVFVADQELRAFMPRLAAPASHVRIQDAKRQLGIIADPGVKERCKCHCLSLSASCSRVNLRRGLPCVGSRTSARP